MRSRNAGSPPPPAPARHVGGLLREWRSSRHLSQLDLALSANVSARHLSCVETGKAQPSRELIARLADTLGVPLRERNALLVAAGYAREYRETPLSAAEMAPVRRAIEFILAQQEPYPVLVMNRHWDLLMRNRAMERVWSQIHVPKHDNIVRQVFDPADLRPFLANWEELARDIIHHLHNQVAATPGDERARALLTQALGYPGVPASWRAREPGAATGPLLTTVFRKGDVVLTFFSTLSTFGTPHDVTLDELRIECAFPADDATAERCRALAARDP